MLWHLQQENSWSCMRTKYSPMDEARNSVASDIRNTMISARWLPRESNSAQTQTKKLLVICISYKPWNPLLQIMQQSHYYRSTNAQWMTSYCCRVSSDIIPESVNNSNLNQSFAELCDRQFMVSNLRPSSTMAIKSRKIRWMEHETKELRNTYKILACKSEGKGPLGRANHRWVVRLIHISLCLRNQAPCHKDV
jgi:hypothetical protein